ncbi:hypothetical protein D3C80_1753010 [compost metagenome]
MIQDKEHVMINMDMWIQTKEWAADSLVVTSADLATFLICFSAVAVDAVIRMHHNGGTIYNTP